MRNVERHAVGEINSMHYWHVIRNPVRVIITAFAFEACKFFPSLALKRFVYRLFGVKVGRNAAIGLRAAFDVFFPELIEIGDNSIIGYDTLILTHEFLVKSWCIGKVRIGRNVMIGANCTILPGITVGDNSVIGAHSLVNRDVPPNSLWGGVPVRPIRRRPS